MPYAHESVFLRVCRLLRGKIPLREISARRFGRACWSVCVLVCCRVLVFFIKYGMLTPENTVFAVAILAQGTTRGDPAVDAGGIAPE